MTQLEIFTFFLGGKLTTCSVPWGSERLFVWIINWYFDYRVLKRGGKKINKSCMINEERTNLVFHAGILVESIQVMEILILVKLAESLHINKTYPKFSHHHLLPAKTPRFW